MLFQSSSSISTSQTLAEFIQTDIYNPSLLESFYAASQKPAFFIGHFSLLPVSLIISLKSSLGFDSTDMIDLQYGESMITDRFLSCDNMAMQLKEFTIENVNGGYIEVYTLIRKYIVKEVLSQL